MNDFEYITTETEQLPHDERVESQTILRTSLPIPAPQIDLEEQRPAAGAGETEIVELESIPQFSNELSYCCLLIPRFSDHYLAGDITEDLPRWLKEICISYGWRLSAVMIRPGYLQWVMTVPLTTNPAQFMRITRQQTSQKILEDYPRYKRQNLSGDFWAPGFFISPGDQFQSMDNINSYILQTRKQQGIS